MKSDFDAIVIGGGSAGLAFSKEAAAHGASVLLIERAQLGGTCVNRGCVPKKMMWSVASTLQDQTEMADLGVFDAAPALNFGKLKTLRDNQIEKIVDSFSDQLDSADVMHIQGDAVLISPHDVQVDDQTFHSEKIIIASGTHPSPLDIEGGDLMDLSDDVFTWDHVPERLVVIGGGYIGFEMAGIFNAFGAHVTVVNHGDAILDGFSPGSQKIAYDNLVCAGVEIILDDKPTKVVRGKNGLTVTLSEGQENTADNILNATGRDPNLGIVGDLDPPKQADNGALEIDKKFATSIAGIYAVGDIANRLPLTPVAREDGTTLAKQLFGAPETPQIDLNLVATTAFVFPPIGEVGKTDAISEITTFTAMESMIGDDGLNEGWGLQRDSDDGLQGVAVVGHSAAESISWAAQVLRSQPTRQEMNQPTAIHLGKAEEPLGSDS